MAWVGRFCLGALTGLVLAVLVGVPVVYVVERGGLSAVYAELRESAASSRRALLAMDRADGDGPVILADSDMPAPPVVALSAPGDASGRSNSRANTIGQMDGIGAKASVPKHAKSDDGGTAQQILDRALAKVAPVLGTLGQGDLGSGDAGTVGAGPGGAGTGGATGVEQGRPNAFDAVVPADLQRLQAKLSKIDTSDANKNRAAEMADALDVNPAAMALYDQIYRASKDNRALQGPTEMRSITTRPGETPAQAMQRELNAIAPIARQRLTAAYEDQSVAGAMRRSALNQVMQNACGTPGPGLGDRDCAAMQNLLSGGPDSGTGAAAAKRISVAPATETAALRPAARAVEPAADARPKQVAFPLPKPRPVVSESVVQTGDRSDSAAPATGKTKRERRWAWICDPARIATLNTVQKATVNALCAERRRRVAAGQD